MTTQTVRITGVDGKQYDLVYNLVPAQFTPAVVVPAQFTPEHVTPASFTPESLTFVSMTPVMVTSPPPSTAPTITKFTNTPQQNLVFSDGSAYNVQMAAKSYALTMIDNRTLRFELHQGDHAWFDATPDRAELSGVNVTNPGNHISVAFQMLVEAGVISTAQWLLFAEIHNADGVSGVPTSPPIALEMAPGDFLQVVLRYCPKGTIPSSGNVTTQVLWKSSTPLVRDVYHDIKIDTVNDNSVNGSLSVSIDGVQVVNYHGPVAYAAPIYFEEGIYRHTAPEIMAARFRNLIVA